MGGDLYCAICGGPLREVCISHEPRTEAFKAAVARGEEPPPRERIGEPPYLEDEKDTYDPDVITKNAAAWTENAAVLAFNPTAEGQDQGFVTAEGYDDGFHTICVTRVGHQRHEDYAEGKTFAGYSAFSEYEVGFPLHPVCYGVFRHRLAHELGEDGAASVNKGVLFSVFRSIPDSWRCLEIDYGRPSPPCDHQSWPTRAGEEIFAADPGPVQGLEERVTDLIAAGFFARPPPTGLDLGHKVKHDPFQTLPYDVILRVGEKIDNVDALLSWIRASWFAHAQLRNAASSFWKQAVISQMSWFYELLPCIRHEELRKGSAMRSLYLWAACGSEPRLWMKRGYFLRLANRRRIWTTPCAVLAARYCRVMYPRDNASEFYQLCLSSAACSKMYTVAHDAEAQLDGNVEKSFWFDEWEDTYTKSQNIEAFFRQQDGWLVGISVLTEGGRKRILGSTEAQGELTKCEAVVPAGDWISGILLHIPAVDNVGRPSDSVKTSVKGITINCKSGIDLHLGETRMGHAVRPLMARAGRQIIGIAVQHGVSNYPDHLFRYKEPPPDATVTPFARIGLLTLWETQLEDRIILPDDVTRLRWDEMAVDHVLWQDDGTRFFDAPYWNNPSLRFPEYDDVGGVEQEHLLLDKQLVPRDVFLWARNAAELRLLKTVSIFTACSHSSRTGEISDKTVEERQRFSNYHICGLGAEYTRGHTEERRLVGIETKAEPEIYREAELKPTPMGPQPSRGSVAKVGDPNGDGDSRIDVEIDGPGGEVITEVFYRSSSLNTISAVKFRTDRGREGGCWLGRDAEVSDDNAEWTSIPAPPGRTLVGLVVSFAHGCGNNKEGHHTFNELTSICAIAMELGVDGEGTIPDDDDWYEDTEEHYPLDAEEDSDAIEADGEGEDNESEEANNGDENSEDDGNDGGGGESGSD